MSEYPELSEAGKKEAEQFIDRFKSKMKDVCEEVLGEVYVDLMPWIETDSWQNYRNAVQHAVEREYFSKPKELLESEEYWAQKCRAAFYREYKDELVNARVRDLEKEVEKYKEWYQQATRYR